VVSSFPTLDFSSLGVEFLFQVYKHYQELAPIAGRPANGIKQKSHITRCRFDN